MKILGTPSTFLKVLGIETSCDETSAAVVESRGEKVQIVSNIVSSQIDIHKKYGGVVPEVASRAHIESIIPAVKESLKKAKIRLKDIDLVAVTVGPGLVGSLLVGVNTAKVISFVMKKPLVAVNHLEGHVYANFVSKIQNTKYKTQKSRIEFPAVVLIASGGHTMLVLMKDHLNFKILGQTKDDAAGEAFDKVAKILDISYPGGPIIEKLSKKGNSEAFDFPRAEMEGKTIRLESGFLKKLPPNLDFSFSGLKTAVLYQHKTQNTLAGQAKHKKFIADIAASFQKAVIDVLVSKTIWAAERTKAKSILISGGVAANEELRKEFYHRLSTTRPERSRRMSHKPTFWHPPKNLCTDNAAMIAAAGYFRVKAKKFTQHFSESAMVKINPNLKLR